MLAIDLCAGIGWSIACQWSGISELGIEIMPEAIATRTALGAATYLRDGKGVGMEALPDDFCSWAPIQIAGPPCQTFSPAGSGEGRRQIGELVRRIDHLARTGELIRGGDGDARTWLVLEPLRLALHGLPTYVVWEQVPSVLPVWEASAVVMRAGGYSVWTGILRSEQYGVPQTRKRAFLIARRDGIVAAPPVPTHSRYHERDRTRLDDGVLPWVSMAEALGWSGGTMISNYGSGGDPRDRGERSSDQPAATVTGKVGRNKWVYVNGTGVNAARRPAEVPAPTVHFGARSNGRHWTEQRPATTVQGDPRIALPGHHERQMNNSIRVTVEEAAVLQTFPYPELIQGTPNKRGGQSNGTRYLQVGNMVPPLLGAAILRTFLP